MRPAVSSKRRVVLGITLIIILTGIIYIPAMRAGFIWDDDTFLTKNELISADNGLYRFWFTTEAPDYFPLTSTTLWFEWRLWGMNATGYHVVNVLLHILSSILLWRVLKRLKVPGAWLAGLIFAIHPVNVESVAWITERKNVLPMVFYALSILLYLKFESDGHRWLYGFSLIVFLLGLLSKTSVVMLPFVILGCAWWQRGRIIGRDIVRTIPFFVMSIVLGLVTVWFQYNLAETEYIVRTDSFFSRLSGAGWCIWFYLYKAIIPIRLTFVYPRWEIDAFSIISYMPGLLLVGLLVLFWWFRRSWARPLLFALGYYIVTLLPVIGFLNIYFMKYSLVADHWQYTSIIGPIALLVGIGSKAYEHWHRRIKLLGISAAVVLVGLLSWQTWTQAHIYQDLHTLWKDTLAKNPDCWMAHDNLGVILGQQGNLEKAVYHLSEAVRLNPNNEKAHNNLGIALAMQGRYSEAIHHYREALRIKPRYRIARRNLDLLLHKMGMPSGFQTGQHQ